jgi:hypothetical protein
MVEVEVFEEGDGTGEGLDFSKEGVFKYTGLGDEGVYREVYAWEMGEEEGRRFPFGWRSSGSRMMVVNWEERETDVCPCSLL